VIGRVHEQAAILSLVIARLDDHRLSRYLVIVRPHARRVGQAYSSE
jgi:hypothetical protein